MIFPKQIIAEMLKMLRSKFILISAILIFAFIAIAVPILTAFPLNFGSNYYYNYGYEEEPLIIDGIEVELNNQMAWELHYLMRETEYIKEWILDADTLMYAQGIINAKIDFYKEYIFLITGEDDYRIGLSYQLAENSVYKYVLTLEDYDEDKLKEAFNNTAYTGTSIETLLEFTETEKAERLATIDKSLDDFDQLMKNDDFSKYCDIQKDLYNAEIEANLERIETLEADLIKNPSQEDYVANEIRYLVLSNTRITENYIPELDYRLENNIIYNDGSWQDVALSSISGAKSRILSIESSKLSEEDFYEDQWLVDQHGSYLTYENSIIAEIEKYQYEVLVGENSMANGKPDMDFVPDGARNSVYNGTFPFTTFIVVFSILIGGWVIASEFQSGTVRLLVIRPRTRIKILLSKYLAGIKIVYALYLLIFITVILTQGFMSGFSDYLYPNYTASGEVNFFLMLIGHFFVSSLSFVFIYTLSFMVSVLAKNIAVAIIVPTIVLFGTMILMTFAYSLPPLVFLAYTPLPYLSIHEMFTSDYSMTQELIEKGIPLTLGLGAFVMIIYSGILITLSTLLFKKQDITN